VMAPHATATTTRVRHWDKGLPALGWEKELPALGVRTTDAETRAPAVVAAARIAAGQLPTSDATPMSLDMAALRPPSFAAALAPRGVCLARAPARARVLGGLSQEHDVGVKSSLLSSFASVVCFHVAFLCGSP
jgi:hypothetical protein